MAINVGAYPPVVPADDAAAPRTTAGAGGMLGSVATTMVAPRQDYPYRAHRVRVAASLLQRDKNDSRRPAAHLT